MRIGIDLGTTHSLASFFLNGRTELIPNAHGHFLTPSAVSIGDDGEVIVGLAARERIDRHPDRTALSFKRWMGTDRVLTLGKRKFTPIELSALVLRSLKNDAEAHLGQPVSDAVISVPAYFNQVQREATLRAAAMASLKVERLINEPTAAGLAYGLQERTDHTNFLIFDLGGGTFDVSVLGYFEGVVEVRASAGDTRLGGEDFTQILEKHFLEHCEGLTERARNEFRLSRSLWRAAEQAKRDLSEGDEANMQVSFDGQTHALTIHREEYELASADLLLRLRRPIERALSDARITPSDLDEVVLVGGATRMPIVRQMVARLFQRLPLRTVNPDETIARGAAIQAALMDRDASLEEIVLTDVMPYSLGIVVTEQLSGRMIHDRFSPIIERNSPVPISRVSTYSTLADNQTFIELDIRQGESPIGSDNLQLDLISLPVPPAPAGRVAVSVRFSYDASGLLAVDAEEHGTGERMQRIVRQSGCELTEGEVSSAMARLDQLKVHPRDMQENIYLMERAKRLYEDRLGSFRPLLQQYLADFELALESQDVVIIGNAQRVLREKLDAMDKGFIL
ncbi:MAG: Hsp70 family protein [Pseudomonadota bacterium]